MFDKSLNPLEEYNANYGYIEDADVTVSISDSQNKVIWFIEEKTNQFGYSIIEFRVENSYLLVGEYSASISVMYEENVVKQTVPIFINPVKEKQHFSDFLTVN